jgi:hypothetical protein
VQLGELQSQLERFENRGVKVVALSVDPPAHSRLMIRRMGLDFPIASDESQEVQKTYRVQNPETQELALHAVFIVSEDGRVFYRKIASRRPKSQELLDAIDYYQGNYPVADQPMNHDGTVVAFPTNNFQALLELATNSVLPASIDPGLLMPMIDLIRRGDLDDATVGYRAVMQTLAGSHSEQQLLATAAWFTRTTLSLPDEAMLTGRALNQALRLQRDLLQKDSLQKGHENTSQTSNQELDAVQRDLDTLRATIRKNAVHWRLRSAKVTLRSYRELSLAALQQ